MPGQRPSGCSGSRSESWLCPVALQCRHQSDIGIGFQRIRKTIVSFDGGRRAFQTHDLHHVALSFQTGGNVFAHHTPHLVIIGTDKGRVFLGIGFPFENNDRDALIVGSVDGGRNGGHLVGGNNQQVDACINQTVNLLYLSFIAVVGCCKAQFHILVEVGTHPEFGILFLAPDIFRALGTTTRSLKLAAGRTRSLVLAATR